MSLSSPSVFFLDRVTVETWALLAQEDRDPLLSPLPSESGDIEILYGVVLRTIAFGTGESACTARATLQDLLGNSSMNLRDALAKPKLDITSLEQKLGCSYRITGMDSLFLNRWLWEQWRDALAARSPELSSLQIVIVATIVHELAHWCVSLAVGTIDRQLDIDRLYIRLERELILKVTPDKKSFPWRQEGRAEAGQFMEWKVFGGIMEWVSRTRQAMVCVGPTDFRVITKPMADRGARAVFINFVEEFSLPDTISPSPSSTTTAVYKESCDAPRSIPVCKGITWNVNLIVPTAVEIQELRQMAAHEALRYTNFNYWKPPVQDFALPDFSPPSPALSARSDTSGTFARIRNSSLVSGRQISNARQVALNKINGSASRETSLPPDEQQRSAELRQMSSFERLSNTLSSSWGKASPLTDGSRRSVSPESRSSSSYTYADSEEEDGDDDLETDKQRRRRQRRSMTSIPGLLDDDLLEASLQVSQGPGPRRSQCVVPCGCLLDVL
ncbi:hypothetical protein C8R47DRAFT_1153526 [Mycena vitilis]|nr:hypothetical protein C8R47DRAFT_1153526 [Mycena vitilis]